MFSYSGEVSESRGMVHGRPDRWRVSVPLANVELKKQDLDMIHRTVNEQVHGKPVGTTAKWSNPESHHSGKIALVRKFTRNGQQCETPRLQVNN